MRNELRISPSQIKRWRQCPRLSAHQFAKTPRADDPLPRANDLGSRCHEIAEAYLRDGTPPDEGETFRYWRTISRPDYLDKNAAGWLSVGAWGGVMLTHAGAVAAIARDGEVNEATDVRPGTIVVAGLHLLPAPRSVEVETEASFTTETSTYAARADMRRPGWIGDHKFVRDYGSALGETPGHRNSYGDPSWIGDDPQYLIQGAAELVRDPELAAYEGTWIYYETKPRSGKHHAKRVHLRMLRDDVGARMADIERDAAQIQTVFRHQIDPRALPPNPKACQAYGRPCDYVSACALTATEVFRATMTQTIPMDQKIQDVLNSLTSGALAPQVLGSSAPPPPPPPPPVFRLDGPEQAKGRPAPPPPPPARPAPPPYGYTNPAPVPPRAAPPPPPPAVTMAGVSIPLAHPVSVAPGSPADRALDAVVSLPPRTSMSGPPIVGNMTAEQAEVWARTSPEDQAKIKAAQALMYGPDPVNPPEAPPNDGERGPAAAAKRKDAILIPAGGIAAIDPSTKEGRDLLKGIAVERGILTTGSRLGGAAIMALLVKDEQTPAPLDPTDPATRAAILGPPPPPPPPPGLEVKYGDLDALANPEPRSEAIRAADIRQALDAINTARRVLERAEAELHAALFGGPS